MALASIIFPMPRNWLGGTESRPDFAGLKNHYRMSRILMVKDTHISASDLVMDT